MTNLQKTIRITKLSIILMILGASLNAQKFEKDDLAHIEAGALIHSATYFGVSALDWEDKWKYILPAITVNTAGVIKEISDSQKPNNRFDVKDLLLNNVGMLISMGLIEGMKAIGVPENIAVGSVITISTVSLGLTVNF